MKGKIMREGKNNYRGFGGLLRYIRDWEDNRDNDLISEQRLIDANKEIEKLKAKIKNLELAQSVAGQLIERQDIRIKNLNKKISELKKKEKTK